MKRPVMQRVGDFMEGKGFYIVLLLCVATLGVSGYYLFSGGSQSNRPVSGPAQIAVTATPWPTQASAVQPVPPSVATPRPTAAPTPAPAPTEAPAMSADDLGTATASVFTWPVRGGVDRGYMVETLAYDETMGDWRCHDGIDINADAGTPVMAPAGGTVTDIYTDDLMGTTVVILHADEVMSRCANLATVPSVEIGDTVRTGDVIGSVGTTAIAESGQGSHLHLSMTQAGVSVDPTDYLPKK